MQSPRASAFRKLYQLSLIAFGAGLFLAPVAPAYAAGMVSATVLDGYERPLTVVVDLMDDSLDSQAIAINVKRALAAQGIPAVEDGEYILEVNVTASADTAGGDRTARADADRQSVTARADQLSQLAPTRELSPNAGDTKTRRTQGAASLDLTMLLYKQGKPAMWRAYGSASRDFRSIADQGSALALEALKLMGKSGTASLDR